MHRDLVLVYYRRKKFFGKKSHPVVNFAGPRESKSPGVQAATRSFVTRLIGEIGG